MKIQRDLTTILYILASGIYLIVGARSFARAPDTPETGYFYLIGPHHMGGRNTCVDAAIAT